MQQHKVDQNPRDCANAQLPSARTSRCGPIGAPDGTARLRSAQGASRLRSCTRRSAASRVLRRAGRSTSYFATRRRIRSGRSAPNRSAGSGTTGCASYRSAQASRASARREAAPLPHPVRRRAPVGSRGGSAGMVSASNAYVAGSMPAGAAPIQNANANVPTRQGRRAVDRGADKHHCA
jgi:hypothetical protein